jgi:hypothetical protein
MTEPVQPDPMSEESDVGWGDEDRTTESGDDADREVDIDGEESALGWGADPPPPHYDNP